MEQAGHPAGVKTSGISGVGVLRPQMPCNSMSMFFLARFLPSSMKPIVFGICMRSNK